MQNDDTPCGRVLTRKEALVLMGGAGLAALSWPRTARAEAPSCVARPEMGEGPFFLDKMKERSDLRSDPVTGVVKDGALLSLGFNVSRLASGGCEPLPGAVVDIWHCDAAGVYSGVGNTEGQLFLRGYQVTDANGAARFTTIYPGWYTGRPVHIHFKIRPAEDSRHEFTSQLFFDDALNDRIYAKPPYTGRGEGKERNEDDGMFRDGGKELLLDVEQTKEGYAGVFELALDLS